MAARDGPARCAAYTSMAPSAVSEGPRGLVARCALGSRCAGVATLAAAVGLAAAALSGLGAGGGSGAPRVQRHPRPEAKVEDAWSPQCPGSLGVLGYGSVALTNTAFDTPGEPATIVEAKDGTTVVAHMGGRAYFSESCSTGQYDPSRYVAVNLLGKTLSYTTDVSGAGCGCNAALYLVAMRQNQVLGECGDYYCDANKVCGVPCAEIDIQEANMHSWFSTLHLWDDGRGFGFGYGGDLGLPMRRDWTSKEYGPGARCIDTTKPFEVAVSFPVDGTGQLTSMRGTLSQGNCSVSGEVGQAQEKDLENGVYTGKERMSELTDALSQGMTIVVSFWSSKSMTWMDGPGEDGAGPPCPEGADDPGQCPETAKFTDIRIESLA